MTNNTTEIKINFINLNQKIVDRILDKLFVLYKKSNTRLDKIRARIIMELQINKFVRLADLQHELTYDPSLITTAWDDVVILLYDQLAQKVEIINH